MNYCGNVCYVGDTHGSTKALVDLFGSTTTPTTFVHVGDFGLQSHYTHTLNNFVRLLRQSQSELLVIRGNHDNPACFRANYIHEDTIEYLPDGCTRRLGDIGHGFIGGAVSIDRCMNTPMVNYWPDEGVIDCTELLEQWRDVTVVVTHTAPLDVFPVEYNPNVHRMAVLDPALYDELPRERDLMSRHRRTIIANNQITHWVYGHFHETHVQEMGGISYVLLSASHQRGAGGWTTQLTHNVPGAQSGGK